MKKTLIYFITILVTILLINMNTIESSASITKNTPYVSTKEGNFYIGDDLFRFVGTNNYYLHYKDEVMIKSVLDDAKEAGFNVIRMWGFFDGDGLSITENKAYMQPSQGDFSRPSWAENDFVSAWDRMDFAVSEAAKRGIRLIIVLSNYWDDFGGISEYVGWYNEKYGYTPNHPNYAHKKDFYTNEEIKGYYKTYVDYFMSRTNQFNGRKYVEDPTIFAWELMNEPRNPFIDGGNITDVTLWADEMSTYIKEVHDSNHLIALGDEGSFYNRTSWDYMQLAQHIYDGSEGVDFEAVLRLDHIDFGTYHLYPESWGIDHSHMEWGTKYIIDHINVGKEIGKPVILEEFGISANLGRNRELIYSEWLEAVYQEGGAGVLFWMYAGLDTSDNATDGGYYPDYDGFRLAEIPGKYLELQVLKNYASLFSGNLVEFEDKIFVTSPYTTTRFIEIESDLLEDQMFPIKLHVRTSSKINKVNMYLDGDFYATLNFNTETNSYEYMFNMRHIYRGSNVDLDFVAYTNHGEIESETIEMKRMLKFDYFENETFTFDQQYGGNDLQFSYYGAYNAVFRNVSWTNLNGGMINVDANYDRDAFWSEVKLEVVNLSKEILLSNYAISYDIYFEKAKLIEGILNPTHEAYDTAPGFRHYAAIDPGWAKIGLNENNIKYFELEEVTIDDIVYLKQNIYIRYNTNPNQSMLVINAVTNHLLYNGNFYIDNLTFYDRTLSQSALSDDDYIDWRYEKELAELELARRRTQTIIIISSSLTGVALTGGAIYFVKFRKRKLIA
jgi:mannan endo-1,4-beta-mannosidase